MQDTRLARSAGAFCVAILVCSGLCVGQPIVLYRINAGGPQLSAADGSLPPWSEDSADNPSPYSNHAVTEVVTRGATVTLDPSMPREASVDLFKTERYGAMQWEFPVTSGLAVEVRLFFAETYTGITDAGQRVFDVAIEDQTVLDDFDLYATCGWGHGVMKAFPATIGPDGKLDIEFTAVVENPLVNGVEVVTYCRITGSSWQNASFTAQAALFEVEYDATPLASSIDGLTGLSREAGATFSDYAVLVRFNLAGTIDARDGDSYTAASVVQYSAGTTYHFRVVVDPGDHQYWVYVSWGAVGESLLAACHFRTEQGATSVLGNWGVWCGTGSHEVCHLTVYPYIHNITNGNWYSRIQAAVDAAASDEELVLSPGRYTGSGNRDVNGRGKSFTVRSLNPNDAVIVESTVIDCQGTASDRHRAFYLRSDQPASVTIAGVTIVNGFAPVAEIPDIPDMSPGSAGGAVFCHGPSLTIMGCIIRDNVAGANENLLGGGVFHSGPRLTIVNSQICDNELNLTPYIYGDALGAGVHARSTERTEISGSTISGNSIGYAYLVSPRGAGFYVMGRTTMRDCHIDANTSGGSEYVTAGGGGYSDGELEMEGCVVENNYAAPGHDVSGFGGGVCCVGTATIEKCTIAGNGCGPGGGVYCASRNTVLISSCIISQNSDCGDDARSLGGGGVSGAATVRNSLILGNDGVTYGGGLDKCTEVIGCTIVGNSIWGYSSNSSGGGVARCGRITNCILWGNWSGGKGPQIDGSTIPTYSCIQDWSGGGEGNIAVDPEFVVAESGTWTSAPVIAAGRSTFTDASKQWSENALVNSLLKPECSQAKLFCIVGNTTNTISVQGDVSGTLQGDAYWRYGHTLRECSPCVDAGDPTGDYSGQIDIDGGPRLHGARVDMGAAELVRSFDVAAPAMPRADPAIVCAGGYSRLSALVGTGADTIEWLTSPCDESTIEAGMCPVVRPRWDTTYFARSKASSTGAVSSLASVQVQVRRQWRPVGDGTNGSVNSLAVHAGELIAGGTFSMAGGANASRIACWNGSVWRPLGAGIDGTCANVAALTSYKGFLAAGGSFDSAGGVSVSNIALWDGTSWISPGSGVDGPVEALLVYKDTLVAGGSFSNAGGTSAACVASWDGSQWSGLGGGMLGDNPTVNDLVVFGGKLVAKGRFTQAGGVSATNIAQWDGSEWQPLGSGISGYAGPHTLATYGDELIAADGRTSPGIARWNGNNWRPLSVSYTASSSYSYYTAIMSFDEALVAAGSIPIDGGYFECSHARLDGTSWVRLGDSGSADLGYITTLAVYNGELIASGQFSVAQGSVANNIARLGCCDSSEADLDRDCDVDEDDLTTFVACCSGPGVAYDVESLPSGCDLQADGSGIIAADFDRDGDIDMVDFGTFQISRIPAHN
jgi:hypothetical protein